MKLLFKCFASDESGAVTVDWVVLTAAAVGLSLAAVMSGGRSFFAGYEHRFAQSDIDRWFLTVGGRFEF